MQNFKGFPHFFIAKYLNPLQNSEKCCLDQMMVVFIGTLTFTWRCQMAKKKAAKKQTKAKAKSSKEVLVVASKVKAYVKSKGMMSSSDAIAALNECVYAALDAAINRTQANRRSTVKPQDL